MKFTALVFLASLANAAAVTITKESAKVKLLRSARRVENNNQNGGEDYSFLAKYNLKMISCAADTTVADANGNYDYSAVLFRLCPTESGCDSDSLKGCGAGHGDFIVGMDTFVQSYFEDQRDNMQWDDNFKVQDYMECREYKMEGQGQNNNNGENVQYWIGPACTSGGKDIGLAVFSDEGCITKSETAFEDISNGWTLPYSEGGLISTQCLDCVQYNDDGSEQTREFCTTIYQSTAYKCETSMAYYSYFGQNVEGCEATAALMPIVKKSGKGGKVFGWIVFFLVVAGLVGYVMWWRKKKAGASDGLMS